MTESDALTQYEEKAAPVCDMPTCLSGSPSDIDHWREHYRERAERRGFFVEAIHIDSDVVQWHVTQWENKRLGRWVYWILSTHDSYDAALIAAVQAVGGKT